MKPGLAKFISSFFYIGHIPWAPGTFGSGAGLLILWVTPVESHVFILIFLTLIGLYVCPGAIAAYHSKDPSSFVLDEVCGMALSLLWLPKDPVLYVAGFFLFRALDIFKPGVIRKADRHSAPTSIMWDDILAGLFTNVGLRAAIFAAGLMNFAPQGL